MHKLSENLVVIATEASKTAKNALAEKDFVKANQDTIVAKTLVLLQKPFTIQQTNYETLRHKDFQPLLLPPTWSPRSRQDHPHDSM